MKLKTLKEKFWVYVLEIPQNDILSYPKFYIGQTNHIIRRLYDHFKGLGGAITDTEPCTRIAAVISVNSREEVLELEKFLQKKNFIAWPEELQNCSYIEPEELVKIKMLYR